MSLPENEDGREQEGPVIRDKRRVDPETGELRNLEEAAPPPGEQADEVPEVPAEGAAGEVPADDEAGELRHQINERLADLQRLQAEYANYRKRVERDRAAVREQALAQVLGELLPVLDDIGRAREHGELTGGFKPVGESLEALATKLGLKKYADKDDEFDPNIHEALTMVPVPDATTQTVLEVFQPGYLVGERILRPARVVVAGPLEEDTGPADEAPVVDADVTASAEDAESAPEEPSEGGNKL